MGEIFQRLVGTRTTETPAMTLLSRCIEFFIRHLESSRVFVPVIEFYRIFIRRENTRIKVRRVSRFVSRTVFAPISREVRFTGDYIIILCEADVPFGPWKRVFCRDLSTVFSPAGVEIQSSNLHSKFARGSVKFRGLRTTT